MVFYFNHYFYNESGVKGMNGNVMFIMYAVLMCGLGYLVKLAANFLTAKTNSIRDDGRLRDKELAKIGIEIAERAIKTVTEASVGKLEEIVAKELRQKIKNGEASREELYALSGEAYKEITDIVGPELIQWLSGSIQDVDLYIRNQIENQLLLLKAKLNGGAAGNE